MGTSPHHAIIQSPLSMQVNQEAVGTDKKILGQSLKSKI
jgi:hypothetical protein